MTLSNPAYMSGWRWRAGAGTRRVWAAPPPPSTPRSSGSARIYSGSCIIIIPAAVVNINVISGVSGYSLTIYTSETPLNVKLKVWFALLGFTFFQYLTAEYFYFSATEKIQILNRNTIAVIHIIVNVVWSQNCRQSRCWYVQCAQPGRVRGHRRPQAPAGPPTAATGAGSIRCAGF